MKLRYSVLMSVYKAEYPKNLAISLQSMLEQTILPDQFVLVCDGPLSPELDAVINDYCKRYLQLQVVRLEENRGLGNALNEGLMYCDNDIVVRMDSDDIAHADRCEKQIDFMLKHGLDLCSAAVEEFVANRQVTGRRVLPTEHKDLVQFAQKRNPMNHPCVIFRKDMVEKAGGYHHMPYFEDYDLWARMILTGAKLGNYPDPLLYMRTENGFYRRRSGSFYCIYIMRFWREMCRIQFCGRIRAQMNTVLRCSVSLMPVKAVQYLYQKRLRTGGAEGHEAL